MKLSRNMILLLGAAVASVLLEWVFSLAKHAEHANTHGPFWHNVPGSYALLGLVFAIALVIIAKLLGVIIERHDDFDY